MLPILLVGVALFVALIVTICCLKRRKSKEPEQPEAETTKQLPEHE